MKDKLYACKECGKEVRIRSKSLCQYCRNKQKPSPLKRYILKQTTKNRAKKQEKSITMKNYWTYHLEVLANGKSCENCGKRLQESVISVCHILPKQRHTDVMDHLSNCAYMCDLCHTRYDRIQSTSQIYLMPVFPIMLKRYLIFRENVVIYSRYRDIFEEYIKNDYK